MIPIGKPIIADSTTSDMLDRIFDAWKERVVVHHYMRADNFLRVARRGCLWLNASTAQKGDQNEGAYPPGNQRVGSEFNRQLAASLGLTEERLLELRAPPTGRERGWIHCWNEAPDEVDFMWQNYGDAFRGVCIRSDSVRIKESLPDDADIIWGRIFYSEDNVALPLLWPALPLMRKQKREYEHEAEFRILCTRQSGGDHVDLPIKLSRAISHLYIGSRCARELVEEIRGAHAAYFPEATVSESKRG